MSDNILELEGVMSIAKAEALHHQLEEMFRKAEDVEIVTKNLERIDTSILQSLTGFVRDLKGAGAKVSWGEQSEVFSSAVEILGLKHQLGA